MHLIRIQITGPSSGFSNWNKVAGRNRKVGGALFCRNGVLVGARVLEWVTFSCMGVRDVGRWKFWKSESRGAFTQVISLKTTVLVIVTRVHSKLAHYKMGFFGSSRTKCYIMLFIPLVLVTLQYHIWLEILFNWTVITWIKRGCCMVKGLRRLRWYQQSRFVSASMFRFFVSSIPNTRRRCWRILLLRLLSTRRLENIWSPSDVNKWHFTTKTAFVFTTLTNRRLGKVVVSSGQFNLIVSRLLYRRFQNWNSTSYLLTLLLPVHLRDFSTVAIKDSIVWRLRF